MTWYCIEQNCCQKDRWKKNWKKKKDFRPRDTPEAYCFIDAQKKERRREKKDETKQTLSSFFENLLEIGLWDRLISTCFTMIKPINNSNQIGCIRIYFGSSVFMLYQLDMHKWNKDILYARLDNAIDYYLIRY